MFELLNIQSRLHPILADRYGRWKLTFIPISRDTPPLDGVFCRRGEIPVPRVGLSNGAAKSSVVHPRNHGSGRDVASEW